MLSQLSLKYRIAVIIFFLEAIMMTIVLQQTLGQSYDASSRLISNNQNALLELFGGISQSALITEEYAELQPEIEHLIANTEASRLLLSDHNNIIVASSLPSDLGAPMPELTPQTDYNWQTKAITNSSGLMGTLAIEFSSKALSSAYKNARDFGITIAITGMLIIAAVGMMVGFLLTRRLAIITATARRLADGDFSVRTNIHAQDELGKLAETFDNMIQGLLKNKNELHKTMKVLQEREQDLSITLHSIGDAVITTDAKGRVTRMNPVAQQLTGWPINEAQGLSLKSIFPIVNASTRETIENPIDKVMATGETIYLSNHTTLISRDGTEYQIADSAAPIIDNGHIFGMVLVFNDVTEQYLLREAVANSRRDLQAIMDNSPAVIYAKDLEGRYIFINQQWEVLFNRHNGNIVGKTDYEIFPKDFADVFTENDKAVLTAGHALKTEESAPHDDGPHIYVTVKFPLFDDNSNIYAICGISTDITEQKQQEEQLRRTLKMDALGKLTGGIAHDYNNMLGVVTGYAELLESQLSAQPKLMKYAHEIYRAGERGTKLTQKLLAFSRNKISEATMLNLNALLRDEQHMLEKTLTVRIKLVLDLDDELWPVWLDESEMEDGLLNMCINAMHAIEGNGQLTIQTRNEHINEFDAKRLDLEIGDYVILSITDTGCGMDATTKEKIFDPFFTTKGEKGTGLGLSQVYGFLTRSNGVIKVYSEPDHGTQLKLYFPRFQEIIAQESAAFEHDIIDFVGHENILVVDDEPTLLGLTCELLNQQGYKTHAASSTEEALNILQQQKIDLVLSDIIMPEKDGFQLAAIVQERYPEIKIQLASGFVDDRHSDMVNEELHKNLLHKPFNSKNLLQRIRHLLDS